jgi:putative phosphoesterase
LKILILSDTHRLLGCAYDAVELERPDLIVHLGDHLSDAEDLGSAFPETDLLYVPGNCDWDVTARESLLIEREGARLFLTHGHLFRVKQGTDLLEKEARRLGANAALFGHTHVAYCQCKDGLWLVNPGACSQVSSRPSYAVMEIAKGNIKCRLTACK